MKCWICGSIADSGEHRIKRSDLIKIHGKGPYSGDQSLVMVKSGKENPIQGPNSKFLKYKKSLCKACNGTKTQKYDEAYSDFIDYIEENEKQIIEKRLICLADVFKKDVEARQRHLYKYFVKSFGCRVVEAGRNVPQNLVDLLDQKCFETNLFITFSVNEDKAKYLPKDIKMVGNGDLLWSEEIDDNGTFDATYYEYYSFLHINYWFNCAWDYGLGARWLADSIFLYLGSLEPLTPEQREEAKNIKI